MLKIVLLSAVFLSITSFAQEIAKPIKADLPSADQIRLWGVTNESNGNLRYLRGDAKIETTEMTISADEIDFNSETDWAYARGHVHLEQFETGDKINADHAEYNIRTDEGKFYQVDGTSPAKVMTSPGVLTTTNPFYFQAQWAQRIKERFIMHHGFLTDCTLPKPWWVFQAPVFDVIPGDRAIARHAVFRLKHVPVFYLPYFYRPLGRNPRQSGFLTPNIGHSTLYGYIYGGGYYWAMNPSYDMTGTVFNFSQRGPAITYDFRGKPNEVSDFNFKLYSVFDRGVPDAHGKNLSQYKEGGTEFEFTGKTEIGGFTGRVDWNYLSSFIFREAFSYSFSTAIWNEVDSVGYLQRHYRNDSYLLNFVAQRYQTFGAATFAGTNPNEIIIQKLPSVEFSSRDNDLLKGPVPVWFSINSSAGLLNRQEPTGVETLSSPTQTFGTGVIGRFDATPRVSTAFRFAGFSLEPGISAELTDWTNSYATNTTTYTPTNSCNGYSACPPISNTTVALANSNLFRKNADFTFDLRTPTVERVFTPPKWLKLGTKVKHVIEGEATYEYVTGVDIFSKIIHFDQTDILSNTNQLTLSLTNRFYKKDKDGKVSEFLKWRVSQQRYFDPTFGGAVTLGANGTPQRNVVLATEEFTPYTFLDGPRHYSPVSSVVTLIPSPVLSLDWRADYDPLRQKMIDQTVSVSVRRSGFFGTFADTAITTDPLLVPQSNQISFGGGFGANNRRGWNAAVSEQYDLLLGRSILEFVQGSYNTNCCGFSVQLRHLNFGIRDENQYLFSFSLANLGTFGSLQKQDRIF